MFALLIKPSLILVLLFFFFFCYKTFFISFSYSSFLFSSLFLFLSLILFYSSFLIFASFSSFPTFPSFFLFFLSFPSFFLFLFSPYLSLLSSSLVVAFSIQLVYNFCIGIVFCFFCSECRSFCFPLSISNFGLESQTYCGDQDTCADGGGVGGRPSMDQKIDHPPWTILVHAVK